MIRLRFLVFCFFAYIAIGNTVAVSFIKPCKPNDHACQKATAIAARAKFVAGVPELGLPPADPIVLDDVRSDDKDIKLGFRNMKVTGIDKSKVLDFYRDLKKSTMTLVIESPVTATGQYTLSGKLLFIPAEGDGDFTIKTEKAKIEVTIKVKDVTTAGKKHWKITGFDYKYDIIGKASITLKNLFGGDEKRAKPVHEILNNSPNELIKELGGPIIRELLTKEVDIVQKFFKAVPVSELEIS